jgi:hypothetical protein
MEHFERDLISNQNHEKLNYIQSEVYKLKESHPELEELLEKDRLQVEKYDSIIKRIENIKKKK